MDFHEKNNDRDAPVTLSNVDKHWKTVNSVTFSNVEEH